MASLFGFESRLCAPLCRPRQLSNSSIQLAVVNASWLNLDYPTTRLQLTLQFIHTAPQLTRRSIWQLMSDQNGNLIYTRPYNKEREREKAKEREGANWLCDGSVSIFGLDFFFFVFFCFVFCLVSADRLVNWSRGAVEGVECVISFFLFLFCPSVSLLVAPHFMRGPIMHC